MSKSEIRKIINILEDINDDTVKVKYPRTFHLPWSDGSTSDDKMLQTVEHFIGQDVVVTEKMDGENSTCYKEHYHARSLDSKHHASRDWLKQEWNRFRYDIPDGWRICGENLYAKHSIEYDELASFFMVFSIWDQHNNALSWDDTVDWCNLLELKTVPVLYRGMWDEQIIKKLFRPGTNMEGYVVRFSKSFSYSDFDKSVAKFVRANHVTTDKHWKETWIPNKLRQPK